MLSTVELRRLVGVLARLGSDFDGERAAAGLLASRMLRDRGLTWSDVLQVRLPAYEQSTEAPRRDADNGADLALCLRCLAQLSDWERKFVRSVATVSRRTPGQSRKLAEIADALRKNGMK